jgi:hypothetical protein
MTGIDARQANVASFRVSFSVFSPRKTPFELAISIKNDETEESNLVRSVGGHQSVKSIHKNTLLSIATELLEIQSATLVPEGHFYKSTRLFMIFRGNCGLLSTPLMSRKNFTFNYKTDFQQRVWFCNLPGDSSPLVP